MLKIIFLFGLSCVGKSTSAKHLENNGALYFRPRRIFSERFGECAPEYYRKLLAEHGDSYWLELITGNFICKKENTLMVTEGIMTENELIWVNKHFIGKPYIIFIEAPLEIRIERKMKRENVSKKEAIFILEDSDKYYQQRGLFILKNKADYILTNDLSMDERDLKIDSFLCNVVLGND